jgi:toxin ParE1/3/4
MAEVVISPEAEDDLKGLGIFTEENWGRKQREKYLAQLGKRMETLAAHSTLGKKRHDLPNTPYSYHEGKHVIFFREAPNGIEVIRVLHDAMDFPRHF